MNRVSVTGLILASVLAVAFLLAACARPAPLRYASHPWPGYEFVGLARQEGWIDPRLVEFVDTGNATESLAALREGQADAAALTLDEVLLARAEGIPLTVVLVFDVSVGADRLLARPFIDTIEALRGRRVGVETRAVGAMLLDHALGSAGLSPSDVVIVPLHGRHLDAWSDPELDAIVTYEPTTGRLMREGAVSLFDSQAMPEWIIDVLAVRADLLAPRGESVAALVEAHFRGLKALRQNPQDTAYRLAARLDLPGDQVLASYRSLQLPDYAGNRAYLYPEHGRLHAAAGRLSAWLVAQGRLAQPDDPAGLSTIAFLQPEGGP